MPAHLVLLMLALGVAGLGGCRASDLPDSCDRYLETASECPAMDDAKVEQIRSRLRRTKDKARLDHQCTAGHAALRAACSKK